MQGTLRTYDQDARDLVETRMKEIVENTAKAFNCEAKVDIHHKYPAVINHSKPT